MKINNSSMHTIDLSDILNMDLGNVVEYRRFQSGLLHDINVAIKTETCYLCGNKCTSYCNSHTIPAFCLRYIAENGKLLNCNSIFDSTYQNQEDGVNKAGTFHLICKKCDNETFKDYEDENNYFNELTDIMLAQIALKDVLKAIWGKMREMEMLLKLSKQIQSEIIQRKYEDHIATMELLQKDYNFAVNALSHPNKKRYALQLLITLPYKVPIAYQGAIELFCDLSGNVINNIYNKDSIENNQSLHLAILPFKESSVILMFVEENKKKKKYKQFFHQLRKLSEPEQLAVINYIVFAYTDDYFISPTISDDVLIGLKNMASKSVDIISPNSIGLSSATKILCDSFSFVHRFEIENLLHEKYKIK